MSFREVLEDRYAATTGASLQDVLDAARNSTTVVLTGGSQSVQVSPHVDGDLLTFFTPDGAEYRAEPRG